LSETRIRFAFGTVTLTSKLIDGTFPDYERVIPRDNDKRLRIAKKDFAEAVDRVAAISTERSRPVKLAIARDGLTLSAASPETGRTEEEIEKDRLEYDSSPIEIGFQARYLRDITETIGDAGRVEFAFHDHTAPTLIRAEGDASALYVLMPMRV
ncbi:MAG: DNA polymerase III subunit beta, partial [Elioraea sp.]|nr:DNA polymerase III subunit beta [Elioraea sp.]